MECASCRVLSLSALLYAHSQTGNGKMAKCEGAVEVKVVLSLSVVEAKWLRDFVENECNSEDPEDIGMVSHMSESLTKGISETSEIRARIFGLTIKDEEDDEDDEETESETDLEEAVNVVKGIRKRRSNS